MSGSAPGRANHGRERHWPPDLRFSAHVPLRQEAGNGTVLRGSFGRSCCRRRFPGSYSGRSGIFPLPPGRSTTKWGIAGPEIRLRSLRRIRRPVADRGPEVGRAPGQVHLHQVIGADPKESSPWKSSARTVSQSFTPRKRTVWLPSGMPASASIAQARCESAVSSAGWLK